MSEATLIVTVFDEAALEIALAQTASRLTTATIAVIRMDFIVLPFLTYPTLGSDPALESQTVVSCGSAPPSSSSLASRTTAPEGSSTSSGPKLTRQTKRSPRSKARTDSADVSQRRSAPPDQGALRRS